MFITVIVSPHGRSAAINEQKLVEILCEAAEGLGSASYDRRFDGAIVPVVLSLVPVVGGQLFGGGSLR